MSCNCKGKRTTLNNIDSVDHLAMASDVYLNHIDGKDTTTLSENDTFIILQTYRSLYPNQKMDVTLEQALITLGEAHNKYISTQNGKKTNRKT